MSRQNVLALVAFMAVGIALVYGRAPLPALRSALAAGEVNLHALNSLAYSGLNRELSGEKRLLLKVADSVLLADR